MMNKKKGFSLIEMMLVLVIITVMMAVYIQLNNQNTEQVRREKVAVQMSQILSASLAYYVNNGAWPATGTLTSSNALVSSGYIPSNNLTANYYNSVYTLSTNTTSGTFSVATTLKGTLSTLNNINAGVIAGLIPLGSSSSATVTGTVNIPGQNLNNAMAINFAGIYNATGCVPAPNCPSGMSPAIYVVPVSVNGDYTMPQYCSSATDPTTCVPAKSSAITGYSAYAVGAPNNGSGQFPYTGSAFNPGTNGTIPSTAPTIATNVSDCPILNTPTTISCFKDSVDGSGSWITDPNKTTQLYWRVCLYVNTSAGMVDPNRNNANFTSGNNTSVQQGMLMGQIAAFTRCVPNNGIDIPSGTPLNIWTFNGGNKD
jgi:competence protein ComGC